MDLDSLVGISDKVMIYKLMDIVFAGNCSFLAKSLKTRRLDKRKNLEFLAILVPNGVLDLKLVDVRAKSHSRLQRLAVFR